MRLFAAVRPSADALDHLAGALDAAGVGEVPGRGGPPAVRLVPRDQQHVTLAFYGSVPDGALDDLVAALCRTLPGVGQEGAGVASAVLAGAGVFSGRTLWVGVRDDPDGAVRSLAVGAAEAADLAGVRVADEDRPRFRAHLTVARLSARGAGRRREERGRVARARRELGRRSREADGADRDPQRGGRGGGPRRGGPWELASTHPHADPSWPGAPVDPLDGPAHALAVYVGPAWPLDEVEIVASRLGEGPGGGPLHEVVARVPLLDHPHP